MTQTEHVVLERKLTWGGLLTIATILVTAGINWGISQAASTRASEEIVAIKSDVEDIKAGRFSDNSRMVRVETLLGEILEEVKARR